MIWIIGYLVICIIVGLGFYAYECWKFTNSSYWKDWDNYCDANDVAAICLIVGIFWLVLIFVGIFYFIITIPAGYIKKYFGIE